MSRRDQLADCMVDLVAEHGLPVLSVRAVAARAGVSIGTVQYHFPTKDRMLEGAFARVVARVAARADAVAANDHRDRLAAVLCELLPLDAVRQAEASVMVTFAAAASTHTGLASVQTQVLAQVLDAVARCIARLRDREAPLEEDLRAARCAVAMCDGLALHFISAPGTLSAVDLGFYVDVLVRSL